MLVSVGLGWSVLPQTLISQDLERINMADNVELQRYLGVVINPKLTQSNSVTALLDLLALLINIFRVIWHNAQKVK